MATQSTLSIRISADATQATSAIHGATQAINNLSAITGQTSTQLNGLNASIHNVGNTTNTTINNITNLNSNLSNTNHSASIASSAMSKFGAILGGLSIAVFAKSVFEVNKEMQALRSSLETSVGSLNNARIAFEGIQSFAAKTPYSVKEITDAFIKLKNLGLSPSEAALTSFGNTASAMGKGLDQMIEAVADAATGEFERLKEFGIKSSAEGEKVKFTFKGVETTVKNSSEAIQGYLLKIGNTDFAGGMDKMSTTMKGALSNLGGSWDAFQDHLLNSNKENAIAQWMMTAANSIGKFDVWLNGASSTIGKIQELQKEQNILVQSIRVHESNGAIGGLIDDASGYDVNQKKNALEQNIKQIAELKKTLSSEQNDYKKMTASSGAKGISPEIQSIIENAAQKHHVDQAMIKAVIDRETGGKFNQNATNGVSVGLMQIEPITAKQFKTDFEKVTKDAVTNVDVGTMTLVDALNKAKGKKDEALARYNWGNGNVDKFIAANHGEFDVTKLPAQRRDYVEATMKKVKDYGGSDSDSGLVKFYKDNEQAAKHLATEQEQAAKKITDSDRQLTESTAFGKYNATIDDLTDAFKRNGISQATYSQGIENANETLLKNTDYVVENAKALKEQAKEYEKMLGHIGDYNATIDESSANLANKSITPQQHGLNVAQANAGLMNNAADAYPSAKIANIPVNQAAEVIDKKNINESAKELAKFTEESNKAITALDSFGNSGKMAFDGLLGGISAVASAATSFGDEMSKLNNSQNAYAEKYNKIMADSKKTEADKATATKGFAKEKEAFDSKALATEINGVRQIAGAAAKMFGEKSTAAKAFHGIEMGLAVVSMAMSAKKMVVDIAAGAAAMFGQSGWAGFAGVAAMAAVMAGLGVAMSGGGGGIKDLTSPDTKSTGTVLGDKEKQSNSISDSLALMVGNGSGQLNELKDLNSNFKALNIGISDTIVAEVNSHGKFVPSTNGAKAGNTGAYEAIGSGIITSAVEVTQQGMQSAMTTYDYSTVKKTVKGWFSNKKTIYDVVNGVDTEMTDAFTTVFQQVSLTMADIFHNLKIDNLIDWNFIIPSMKLTFTGKKDSEIADLITGAINGMTDQIAASMAGGLFQSFAQMGEGMLKTISRIYSQVRSVSGEFTKLDVHIDAAGMGLVEFSDSLARVYDSTGTAGDGVKNFISSVDAMYAAIYTKTQQTSHTIDEYSTFVAANPQLSLSADPSAVTGDQFQKAFDIAQTALSISSTAAEAVLNVGQAVNDKFNPSSPAAYANSELGSAATWVHKPLANATWDDVYAGADSTSTMLAASKSVFESLAKDAKWGVVFSSVIDTLDSNSAKKASAADTPYDTVAAYNADLAARQATDTTNANALKNVAAASQDYKIIADNFQGTFKSLNESIMSTLTTSEQTDKRAREKTIADLNAYNKIPISKFDASGNQNISDEVIAQYDKFSKTTMGAAYNLRDANGNLNIFASGLQALSYYLEDTAKKTKALADATKYMDKFSASIHSWVQGLKATSIGTAQSQLDAANANLTAQMAIINGGLTTSAEEKRTALSGITGVADTYIAKIKESYGTTAAGQDMIAQVIKDVSGFSSVDIPSLQLGVLESIRDGSYALPTGISTALLPFFTALNDKIHTAQANYIAAPTAANDLTANTYAKEMLFSVAALAKGDDKFTTALMQSFTGDTGLDKAVNLIVNSDSLDPVQMQSAVDSVLTNLMAIPFGTAGFKTDFLTNAKAAIDAQIVLLNPAPVYLNADVSNIGTTINGLISPTGSLGSFADKTYTTKLDVSGIDGDTGILKKVAGAKTSIENYGLTSGTSSCITITGDTVVVSKSQASKKAVDDYGLTDRTNAKITISGYSNVNVEAFGSKAHILAYKDMDNTNANITLTGSEAIIASLEQVKASAVSAMSAINAINAASNNPIAAPTSETPGLTQKNTVADDRDRLSKLGYISGIESGVLQTIMSDVERPSGYNSFFSKGNEFAIVNHDTDSMIKVTADGWSYKGAEPVKFAKGGIATQASIFGEAGAEAAVPLPDGRSIPVTLNRAAANDSSADTAETIAELKETNRQLAAALQILQAGFTQILNENKKQTDSLDSMESKARIQARAAA